MSEGDGSSFLTEQRIDMWSRWKAGQSLHEIGRAFGKDHVSIRFLLAQHGGIAPAARRRSPLALTLAEREDISRGIACGSSIREIAKGLQRAVSTVSREVAASWRAAPLSSQAKPISRPGRRPCGPSRAFLPSHGKLQEIVASKLMLDWSPEQISGWLKRQYPEDESLRVSHETIYRSLFIQARGALKQELMQHLRSKRRIRRSRHARSAGTRKARSSMPFPFANDLQRSKIAPFPAIGRAICLRGAQNSHIATLVERHSRFSMLVKVPGKDTATVVAALSQHVAQTSRDAAALVDLGSRAGDGPAQKLHDGHGSEGLLLRSAEPLAARLERKHQRAVAPVLPEENRLVGAFTIRTRRDRSAPQSASTKNFGISNSGG